MDKALTTSAPPDELIADAAHSARLLVASDFDGTIAPFNASPEEVAVDPLAIVALRQLSDLPFTEVGVISGRNLSDLRQRLPGLDQVKMIGNHGSEHDKDLACALSDQDLVTYQRAADALQLVSGNYPGSIVEKKVHGVTFHYRAVRKEFQERAFTEALAALASFSSGILRQGKMVIEFSVTPLTKGMALRKLISQFQPSSIVFIGDDSTDEDAFEELGLAGISIKVGGGDSAAQYRVDSEHEAALLLSRLVFLRAHRMK